jgi:sugar/nucleoside kinase (ribokinase family)
VDDTASLPSPRFLLAGQLRRDFIVLPSGDIYLDVPGGNVLYAATGLAVWEPNPPPGVVARVGDDYPQEWLNSFASKGFDRRGIHVLTHPVDLRSFIAYSQQSTRIEQEPAAFFAQRELPFPKILLNYQAKSPSPDSHTRLSPTSIRQGDLPAAFMEATAVHVCPVDYLTHSLLPAILRQAGFTFVTLDPSFGYMNPSFREVVPSLVTGLSAFLPAEEELRNLFLGRSDDLWEMAEIIASYGCELVVIKRGERGQLLYDATTRSRWEVPAYPIKLVDPTGVGDAFCGGFHAGYQRTFDPLMAVLHGNISASMVIEGFGPFYALDALPGLAQARLDSLRHSVRKV